MKQLTAGEQLTLKSLAELFYEVVPLELRTCCALTSTISKAVLDHFAIQSRVVPCQLWCAAPTNNYVIGFIGNKKTEGKWDGHAICMAGNWLIDTALHHLQREFQIPVPPVAVLEAFAIPTQIISRADLSHHHTIWWHRPPQGANTRLPQNPQSIVSECAAGLIERMTEMSSFQTLSLLSYKGLTKCLGSETKHETIQNY